MKTFKEHLQGVELLVRSGELIGARERLFALRKGNVPRPATARLARLFRRAGLPEAGLHVLKRHVLGTLRRYPDAMPEERLEYAACLIRLGAREEGLHLLEDDEVRVLPLSDLHRALALVATWDYTASIAPLERFLARPEVTPYDRLVAKVNLAAAFVFMRDRLRATALLRELQYVSSLRRYPLLLSHTLELAAQHSILQQQWSEAERCLDRARQLSPSPDSYGCFLADKWSLVMGYLRGRFAHLDELRAHARRRGHWETLRECDRFTVLRDGSPSLAAKLLFGTPHSAYRDSLRRELAGRVEFPVEYDVSLGDTSATETAPRLELSTGAFVDGDHHARLTVGQVRHRFLAVLLGERYAPIPLATLFCRIQPQERFQPETSSARIHETARIVRRWLEANRVPLRVARFAGGYYAAATAPITVRYSESAFAQHLHGDVLDSMRHAWDETPFSAMQAARLVGRAPRTVRRLLKEAVEEGILERLGRGRNVRHRFPPRSP